jgi:hypothetical protein
MPPYGGYEGDFMNNFGKRFLATIVGIGPWILLTDPVFKAMARMTTGTAMGKALGLETSLCKHCNLYFNVFPNCKNSPTGKHIACSHN